MTLSLPRAKPDKGIPLGPAFDIIGKMRQRHVDSLRNRMPNKIGILSDPLLNEADLDPLKLNDATAIYDRIKEVEGDYQALIEEYILLGLDLAEIGLSPIDSYQCQVSRRSVPYVEGGPAPADDYSDIWDVIIPGGVDDEVRVSKVAIVREDNDSLKRVYTITAVAQDRLKYIARLTMEDYGLRRP